MRRVIAALSVLALAGLSAGTWLAVDISEHGALINGDAERYPGANTVGAILSDLALIGALFMVVAAILCLIHSAQHGQRGWFIVILLLVPVSLYSFVDAGFTAHVLTGVLSLLASVATLLYSLQGRQNERSFG
jgi:hypothetical protein